MVGLGGRAEVPGQGFQFAVGHLIGEQCLAGQCDGVDHCRGRPDLLVLLAGPLQETDVESCVVRDQNAVAGELQEARQYLAEDRRLRHHLVGDAGEHRDQCRDMGLRIDQRAELPKHLAAAHLHSAELGDRRLWAAAGGLKVDHAERHLGERGAQVFEAGLLGARRSGNGHAMNVRPARRQFGRSSALATWFPNDFENRLNES